MPMWLLLLGGAVGIYFYEKHKKSSSPPSSPASPAYPSSLLSPVSTVGGLTFLNPDVAAVVQALLANVPSSLAQQTDANGNAYQVLTPSTDLSQPSLGTRVSQYAALGQVVILVGPLVTWATSGGMKGPPPTSTVQLLVASSAAQALVLQSAAGGGVVIAPPVTQIALPPK